METECLVGVVVVRDVNVDHHQASARAIFVLDRAVFTVVKDHLQQRQNGEKRLHLQLDDIQKCQGVCELRRWALWGCHGYWCRRYGMQFGHGWYVEFRESRAKTIASWHE
jgi:hypothetical protein